jgi:asparagine synthase (glutamine-hydrolysing)
MKDAGHDANFKRTNDPRRARFEIVQPGRSTLGTAWQDKGAAFDLEIRDPTLDKRLMEFCFGVPEEQYLCQGRDRMLMRRAMEGYLPDVVRLNTRRGLQAADLGYRLTQHRSEMEESLTALRASPLARSLLDLEKLQTVWTTVQARLDFETTIQSQTILTRGVMTGLFLLTFD